MIKPNWNIFKAKFSENPQDNFEWFCYLLFCKEFDKPFGIPGYKNHRHIEHNPIEKDGEVIGWQAKFYDTPLTQHKLEIIKMIEGAKKDYPNLTKIILYTNQNWGQGKKQNDPKLKSEIDEKGKEIGVAIDWDHMENFFNSPFASVDNELISVNFFSLDKGFFDFVDEQQKHTENILNEIRTSIEFNGNVIEIDRSIDLEKLKNNSAQVFVLSGVAGVGKTAIIKSFYHQLKNTTPFFVFKATEFELRSLSDFSKNFDIKKFLGSFKEQQNKIIVIDSAEKLIDLHSSDPFKEFLTIIINNNWKVIFTSRNNYLEDLNYVFSEIYKINPIRIYLQNLDQSQLESISAANSFSLPSDHKLLELIKNPFYLNEYLRFYKQDMLLDYMHFRDTLWDITIRKSKPEREQCFLKIATTRADLGQFFVIPDCEATTLHELNEDGILGYETAGYFITHDIYEEWALEKKIEVEFIKKGNCQDFFKNIGQSLPIRRSFRNWVSIKLMLEDSEIKNFISDVIQNKEIETFWKDEILISVLLSNYSEHFFYIFKDLLLENNQQLLLKITFLLRIACKEVDTDLFFQWGLKNIDLFTLKYVSTKPKGQGWESIIKFVYENLSVIGIENIYFALPIIHDWVSKFKSGQTTKYSSFIALQYYQWRQEMNRLYSLDDTVKDNLLQTILYGSGEISDELKVIFEKILKNKWKNHRDPYYDLSKTILTKLEGISVSQVLPEFVLKLADLFWEHTPRRDQYHYHDGIGVEKYFNLEDNHLDYYPESALKTPIYWLLKSALQQTIDFVIEFTNKSDTFFVKTDFAKHEVQEIKVYISEDKTISQYICDRLWCSYRGTQVSPHVLASMHMALEKFFLERGKNTNSQTLESWLLYLLRKSESVSIPAIVTSIVLAYPEKTFNVAKILFQTKEFIMYDKRRMLIEQPHKSFLMSLNKQFSTNVNNEIYQNERIQTCDESHRTLNLEQLFLNYQMFKSDGVSEEEAEKQQKTLWDILDDYYRKLPPESEQTEADEIWRLCLARMDRRKMITSTEKTDKGILIHFEPEIEPKLKQKSENSLKAISENTRYSALGLWARYKMGNDDRFKDYIQYESNPHLALKEVKEIIKKLKSIEKPELLQPHHTNDETFYLFNYSIPGEVCSVLIRHYFEQFSTKDRDFCASLLFDILTIVSSADYRYQLMDNTKSVLSVLPELLDNYNDNKGKIKKALLFILFSRYSIDMANTPFSAFALMTIHKLWANHFAIANSLLLGYLILEPEYDATWEKIRREKYESHEYNVNEVEVRKRFLKDNKIMLHKFENCELTMDDLKETKSTELYTLKTAFQMIPLNTSISEHKIIVSEIISEFIRRIKASDRDDRIDYTVRHDFIQKLAYFILNASNQEIPELIKPLLDNFSRLEFFADFFDEMIYAQDSLDAYDNFWKVWNLFKEKVIEACKDRIGWDLDKIIKSYLFARIKWKETAVEWHTLKENNKNFFAEISKRMGHCSQTLYSISKLLNNVGTPYLDEGTIWLSDMIKDNSDLLSAKLETNTIYYLEKLLRKFIYLNRQKIKETRKLKNQILVLLDFLVVKGSVIGYILRENII